jgi:hypothetical protein
MFLGVGIMEGPAHYRRLRPCPDDFAPTFIVLGRLACEEHYGVGRQTIHRWLEECGKARLIEARSVYARSLEIERKTRKRPEDFETAYVALGQVGCENRYGAHRRTIHRWLEECGRERLTRMRDAQRLNRRDIAPILSKAFPVKPTLSRGTR